MQVGLAPPSAVDRRRAASETAPALLARLRTAAVVASAGAADHAVDAADLQTAGHSLLHALGKGRRGYGGRYCGSAVRERYAPAGTGADCLRPAGHRGSAGESTACVQIDLAGRLLPAEDL